MINPKTAYWLYILPHTYCNIKADEALIYNTKTGAYIAKKTSELSSLRQTARAIRPSKVSYRSF